jgi:uncharacterized protein YcfJ
MQQRDTTTRTEQRCSTVNEKSQHVVGYDVTYRLDGKDATTRMLDKPGRTLLVKDGQVITAPVNAPNS